MIGVTWNLRSINRIERKRYLCEILAEKKVDFIGLQETEI
jgi:exonuclease III